MTQRIFHLRTFTNIGSEPDMKGGATVVVQDAGPEYVNVSVAICHPNDTFNKKTGREQALKQLEEGGKNVFNIPLRLLPQELGAVQRRIYKNAKVPPLRTNFLPAILNFLPKD